MKKRISWHVEWNEPNGAPCLIISNKSAADAKKQVSKYSDLYSRSTVYRLIKVVETKTMVEKFKSS